MQAYSIDDRREDPYSLPDIEVFEGSDYGLEDGFYWWSCFPGCLPDGDPVGPFETFEDALEDAQDI